ncbi:hypothetical protein [Actinokineospora diospyrosa]|uniref:Uncharacterized protein n=1 Tax=Actinokineospora diospyrosa TaxID=103728 RepID=A0ABT1ICF2_9PSEU|nr:hypothetical protein [Actinokineospora diospyrosa]MCP2270244.1 hypothetical protein [Actinokineospora diospyrosa]
MPAEPAWKWEPSPLAQRASAAWSTLSISGVATLGWFAGLSAGGVPWAAVVGLLTLLIGIPPLVLLVRHVFHRHPELTVPSYVLGVCGLLATIRWWRKGYRREVVEATVSGDALVLRRHDGTQTSHPLATLGPISLIYSQFVDSDTPTEVAGTLDLNGQPVRLRRIWYHRLPDTWIPALRAAGVSVHESTRFLVYQDSEPL